MVNDIETALCEAYDKANHPDERVLRGLQWLEQHPNASNYEQMEIALRGLEVEAERAHRAFIIALTAYRRYQAGAAMRLATVASPS